MYMVSGSAGGEELGWFREEVGFSAVHRVVLLSQRESFVSCGHWKGVYGIGGHQKASLLRWA
jgi:hypothetical protein